MRERKAGLSVSVSDRALISLAPILGSLAPARDEALVHSPQLPRAARADRHGVHGLCRCDVPADR